MARNWHHQLVPILSLFAAILFFHPHFACAELKNFQAADVVIGQPNFTSTDANNGGIGARTLNDPLGLSADGKRLFVTDETNNRVLIWNSIPTTNFAPADVVLGQPDFTSSTANNGGRSERTLSDPRGVFSDGKRLFVADRSNHRILIWNSIPTANFTPADRVLGQPDFVSGTSNNGGASPGARTLSNPITISSDGQRLLVADQSNNRILIWNSIPTTNFAPADVVVGQPDFTQSTANNGGITARTLSVPQGVFSDGKRLFVTDQSNRRVLIWNSIPTTNSAPADVVLGQPDFASGTYNNGGISARSLSGASPVFSDGKRLFVTDASSNRRVLIWNSIPTANFTPADLVVGQPDFTTVSSPITQNSLGIPFGIVSDGKKLFVCDASRQRVLIFNMASGSGIKLGPQFEQGKAVLGKVFADQNGNGIQDKEEKGIEGVKVASDTGIYAITDEDGKYHFPYIEVGQRLLKVDPVTLPDGAVLTTDSPYKVTVTEGILTKVSFGVKLPGVIASPERAKQSRSNNEGPLLKVSITQDPVILKPKLEISAIREKEKIIFWTTCNYFLLIQKAKLTLYDQEMEKLKTVLLPMPLPSRYELDLKEVTSSASPPGHDGAIIHYQLSVFDKNGREDRTGMGTLIIESEQGENRVGS